MNRKSLGQLVELLWQFNEEYSEFYIAKSIEIVGNKLHQAESKPEKCGGGVPARTHTIACPRCFTIHLLSWVPSQLSCPKSDGGCGKIITPFRIYAKDRNRFLSRVENSVSGFELKLDAILDKEFNVGIRRAKSEGGSK